VLEKDGTDSWTDCVKNDKVLQRGKDERNILHTTKGRKANLIGYILQRNCLLKRVFEGKIEVIQLRGRRHTHLLDDLKETR
jgi:hypothetical protein